MSDLCDHEIATIERFIEGQDDMTFPVGVVRRMLDEIKWRRAASDLGADDIASLKAYRGHFESADLPPHVLAIDRILGGAP